jgi:hypothetical protein
MNSMQRTNRLVAAGLILALSAGCSAIRPKAAAQPVY